MNFGRFYVLSAAVLLFGCPSGPGPIDYENALIACAKVGVLGSLEETTPDDTAEAQLVCNSALALVRAMYPDASPTDQNHAAQ